MSVVIEDSLNKLVIRMSTRDEYWKDRLINKLIETIPAGKAMSYFSKAIEVHGTSKKTEVEKIVKCFLLVQNSRTTSTVRQMGWDVEDFVNFQLQPGINRWQQVPVFLRYQNKRLGLIADPEFLMIHWCKKLENYDANNGALLPAYPSDFSNRLLTVEEIQEVLEMWIFKEMSMQNKTRAWAMKLLKDMAPVIFDLVYNPFGREVLQTVYDMHMLIATDPDQGIQTRLRLVEMYQPLFKRFHQNPHATKVGFFFKGFPHPMFRPELVMTVFILEHHVFQPYTDRENMYEFLTRVELKWFTDTILWDFEKMIPDKTFTVIDYDPKTHTNVIVPIHFRFFPRKKEIFEKILDYHKVFYGYSIGVRKADGSLDSRFLFTSQEKEEIKRLAKKRKYYDIFSDSVVDVPDDNFDFPPDIFDNDL